MKYCTTGFILLTVIIGGCQPPIADEGPRMLDVWMIGATNDAAIRNAIIRQKTLFPYQFEQDGADLNNLGLRDVVVLATHFRTNPGKLNIRRGAVSDELYRRRIDNVVECLDRAGVATDKITILDQPAEGDSMPSELVILILEADAAGYKKAVTGSDPTDKPTLSGGSK